MIRKIVKIDEEKCSGCGLCASACLEGAIAMIDGKARLIKDDYCDGLGNCLPACLEDAIKIIEREAVAFDEEAVKQHLEKKAVLEEVPVTCLSNWPPQIKLAPLEAPYYQDAKILVAADCTAYAYAKTHQEFMKGRTTLIGCPKLDGVDYSEKLSEIFARNSIIDITLLRMEVPCCGGLERAVKQAIIQSGKEIPLEVITFAIKGGIL
jgi:Fe-S-cluster-containing hydrogenase component 2